MHSQDDHSAEFRKSLTLDPTTRVEDFLSIADTRSDELDRLLLSDEMSFRLAKGEPLTEEEFSVRFPNLTADIPAMLEQARTTANDSAGATDSPKLSNKRLGDYELLDMIGRGGMGIVYRARQQKLNRIVAVKTIASGQLASQTEVRRFQQEAEAAARLDHPGIVPVYEIGEAEETVYFSMGYVKGSSLANLLERNTLTPSAAAKIVSQLAGAVHFAHQAGVVHRDLKPGNILIDEHEAPKITDFGLAKLIDQEGMTLTGAVVGTPSYMSPEQATGNSDKIDGRSDVYGLGAILYACLCGHAPFRGPSTMATLKMVANQRPASLRQLREDIPRDLETICEKCLEKEPLSRYQTAEELEQELLRFLEGRPILARPVPVWTRFGQWCRRKPVIAALLGAIMISLIGGTIVSSYFAVLAEKRATAAEDGFAAAKEQSELALKTLQTVIHSVQVKLKKIPEARDVRKELLVEVLGDLETVSNGYIAQASVDKETAKVLTDLAELYTIVGDDLGTNVVQSSEKHFRQAVAMYLQLLEKNPNDQELLREGFEAAINCGDTAREYQRFKFAVWAHRQGREIATHWHQLDPENPNAQLAFARSSEALGEALLRSGKADESTDYAMDAVRLSETFAKSNPTAMAYDNLARCYCTAGDVYRKTGEFDKAEEAYKKMCSMTLKLMEMEPENPKLLGDRSTDFERLGDLEMSRKNYQKALEYFELTREWVEKYCAEDPTNLYRLQESTWAYEKLAQANQALGNVEQAKLAAKKLAEIKEKLGRKQSKTAEAN